jgi:hypothetical protein
MVHYTEIHNEPAYEAAKDARIRANRRKGAFKRWVAQHDDALRLFDWLEGQREFAPQEQVDPRCTYVNEDTNWIDHWEGQAPRFERCKCKLVSNPVTKLNNSPFLIKLREQLREWGSLSEKQTQALRDSLARAEGKIVEWAADRQQKVEADRASSQHVGTVGDRCDFDLTVERTFSFDGKFGTTHINICRDAGQNVIVYKGSKPFERGTQVKVKATIKAHDERDGIAQTLISRPVII